MGALERRRRRQLRQGADAAGDASLSSSIIGIYITPGHSGHWLGLAQLLEHLPEARGFATAEIAARAA
jgi:glyoxylase-like metal-dependent hydrolase (beta-lactamase superfamily II)